MSGGGWSVSAARGTYRVTCRLHEDRASWTTMSYAARSGNRTVSFVRALAALCAMSAAGASVAAAPATSASFVSAGCLPASSLLPGTRADVVRAALSQTPNFKLRVDAHAGPRDLNYGSLARACSAAMIRHTWFTDLHPPGVQCSACDSHQYWVLRRHGGWATLGEFSG
jgi:hypothetical protein